MIIQFFGLSLIGGMSAFGQQISHRTFGGNDSEYSYSAQHTSEGGYIIVGATYSFGAGNVDVYLVKTDSIGDTLWTRAYGGTGNEYGYSIQQTTDGGYIISGFTDGTGAGNEDVYLLKTDSSGLPMWTKTYGGMGDDVGYSVRQTSDGGYILTGFTYSFGPGDVDVYLVKTNGVGDILWTKTYGGLNSDYAHSVRQTADGGYIITGLTSSFGAGNWDIYLIKTNGTGDVVWTRTFGGPDYDYGFSAQQTSDGGYIVTGYTESFGAGSTDVFLIKTNSVGDAQWTKTFGGTNEDWARFVLETADGGYIITGKTGSFGGGGYDVYLLKTNVSGDLEWSKAYGGINDDLGYSVQQTPTGGYVINGMTGSFGLGGNEVYMIQTDLNGNSGGCNEIFANTVVGNPIFQIDSGAAVGFGGSSANPVIIANNAATNDSTLCYAIPCSLVASITNIVNIDCGGDSTGSATLTVSGGTSPLTYLWDDPWSQTDSVALSLPAGTYISTVTDFNGCIDTAEAIISQPPPLTGTLVSYVDSGCAGIGEAVVAGLGGTPPFNYSWNSTPTQNNDTAFNLAPGPYTATVTDSNGCSVVTNVVISTVLSITASITGSQAICKGDSSFLTASGGNSFMWNTGDTVSSIVISPTVATSYTLTATTGVCTHDTALMVLVDSIYFSSILTSICQGDSLQLPGGTWVSLSGTYYDSLVTLAGCDSVIATTITAYPVYNIPISSSICQGDSVQLAGGSWVLSPGIYYDAFLTSEGCDSVVATTVIMDSIYNITLTLSICPGDSVMVQNGFWISAEGTYYDSLTALTGCDSLIVTTVSIDTAYLMTPITSVCSGDSIYLGGLYQISAGTYTDTFISEFGCDSVVITSLLVYPEPIVDVGNDTIICTGTTVGLIASSGTGYNYSWTPSTNLTNSGISNPNASPATTTTYTVTVTANGCYSSEAITIEVNADCGIFVPDIFSPNNDGENDILYVYGKGIKDLLFIIYDRWGTKVFETKDINLGWDGKYKGKSLNPAVFVYQLKVTFASNETIIDLGDITLVR